MPPSNSPPSVNFDHGPLQVAENRRYLVHADGAPFFYLGDTAWELFHRLDHEEAGRYLADRAAKRFTVIQAVLLAEINGLDLPNAYGETPLHGFDPARPNQAYFAQAGAIIDQAAELGIYIGLLPTWGSHTKDEPRGRFANHCIFTPDNAYTYGRYLAERYGDRPNIIWILGGDRVPEGDEPIWRGMAQGILDGVQQHTPDASPVMTFHPRGGRSSAEHFHTDPWLTFNMVQTRHYVDSVPQEMVATDYARTPVKPVLNGEPGYENIPNRLRSGQPKLTDYDARKFAYWSVFAGACGHTYGANEIWQMWTPDHPVVGADNPLMDAAVPWHEALHFPGARQMTHVRSLMESRPMLTRIPDCSLLQLERGHGGGHIGATRDQAGRYAMLYIPFHGQTFTVDLSRLAGPHIQAWWFDPRTGVASSIDRSLSNRESAEFTSPGEGPDWVLVLDDAAQAFPPPGQPST